MAGLFHKHILITLIIKNPLRSTPKGRHNSGDIFQVQLKSVDTIKFLFACSP